MSKLLPILFLSLTLSLNAFSKVDEKIETPSVRKSDVDLGAKTINFRGARFSIIKESGIKPDEILLGGAFSKFEGGHNLAIVMSGEPFYLEVAGFDPETVKANLELKDGSSISLPVEVLSDYLIRSRVDGTFKGELVVFDDKSAPQSVNVKVKDSRAPLLFNDGPIKISKGKEVSLTGKNFDEHTMVYFGVKKIQPLSIEDDVVRVKVPDDNVYDGVLRVKNGYTSSNGVFYLLTENAN